ncbi:hypothetical protein BC827DRAFT_1182903, partial [Russula dissimulans]
SASALRLKRRMGTQWEYDSNLTGVYFGVLHKIATVGMRLSLVSEGLHSRQDSQSYGRTMIKYYQGIFPRFGSRGSALTVVPFNQGSKQDVEAPVDYIYMTLDLDLGYIIPFAAVPENGCKIDGPDDEFELAHHIMLVDLLRLLGAVKTKPDTSRPSTII